MSDGQIMEGIRNGDEAAMGEAMEKYSGLLWSVASAVLDGAAPVQMCSCICGRIPKSMMRGEGS